MSLVFAENEVRVNETVSAVTGLETIDTDELKIPANLLSKTSSIQKEGDATGTGQSGEKARGLVDIYNNSDDGITLANGTTLTNISTDLKYVITREVTIPAGDRVEDVPMEASSFGQNYNIVDNSADYVVAGYNTSQMIARSFRDIEGGTTEDVVVVSQEDIDAVKATAIEELKRQLLDSVNGLISEEDILLEGSQTYKEDEFKSSVEAGKEADKFTVDIKMTLSALTVLKSDLSTVAEEVVKRNDSSEGASISVTDPIVRDISISDDGRQATFSLSSKAGVTADLDEAQLKETIAGVSVAEAREYLDSIDGLDDFSVRYSPIYIPFFLQRIPSDHGKITVEKSFETTAEE
ncbi:MAG: hypothetical protein TR69_WS6001000828 [candidate division WS6 bacterium OLB20]|uniref:Baseplate protein J-like domain-containing protein n=1 Tax=candidate division WS6 bacterium OLB20 TaxID=1617426 RepID=A0A136LYY5_9BACT|nr:MAG: hypothetical protein TR69_WS6001000828 [candidate division WS6 bacterium OLB20]